MTPLDSPGDPQVTSPTSIPHQPPAGLRERKKDQTHTDLQTAARALITEHGFDHVSIENITTAANVSRRTFFNHFTSKESAALDPAPESVALFADLLATRPLTETPLQALHAAQVIALTSGPPDTAALIELHTLYRLARTHPHLHQRFLQGLASFEDVIVTWAQSHSDPDHARIYPALLASVASTAVRLTLQHWDPDQGPEHAVHLLDDIYARYTAGLPTNTDRDQATHPHLNQ